MESSKGRGVGLRNTNDRLKALYQKDFSIDIDILPSGGLKTSINIPCEYTSHANNVKPEGILYPHSEQTI